MRINKIFAALSILAIGMVSCTQDDFGVPGGIPTPGKSGNVISLSTGHANGIVSLAVDALPADRAGVWIDLDGDGLRAEDGTEDISSFNVYQDYKLSAGKNTVTVHGNITYFAAASNELTALDVSKSPQLQTLNIQHNRITALDLSKNTALTRLDCSTNSLYTLYVSQNNSLVSLWAFDNQLAELNVSGNPSLAFLDCSGNSLSTLDVTGNSELVRLLCHNNQISSLDISQNEKLNRLWVFGNLISSEEMERIITSLQKVANGSLWIAYEQIAAGQEEQLIEKGWAMK